MREIEENKKRQQKEERDNGNIQGVKTAGEVTTVFIEETSDRRLRRYQKQLGRRRKQRAKRREVQQAARWPREVDDDADEDSAVSTDYGRKRMSTRKIRRQRHRAKLRRSRRYHHNLKALSAAVSHYGGTLEEEQRLADDGCTADARGPGIRDPATGQVGDLETGWVAVHPSDAPSCATRGVDDGILLVVPVHVYGKTLQALIDSGASRCFISPAAVVRG